MPHGRVNESALVAGFAVAFAHEFLHVVAGFICFRIFLVEFEPVQSVFESLFIPLDLYALV